MPLATPRRRLVAAPGRRLRLLLGRPGRRRPRSPAPPSSRRCPVAPLLLVARLRAPRRLRRQPRRGALAATTASAWPVIRLLVAALFAWSASLLTPLDGGAQLALWAGFVVLDTAGRALIAPYLQRLDRAERWVLVGDEATAERLRAYAPLRRLRQRRRHRAARRGATPAPRPRRRPRGRRALPRRPRRHLQPARRRRGPAGPGPRLQVDRRPGQPAAAPARPARGASRRRRAGSAACR